MLVRTIQWAMPVALVCWVIDFVAKEWGIFGVLFPCLGAGAILGLITAVRAGLNPFQIYQATRLGLLPGFLAWMIIGIVLGLLGYEVETAPRKEREAALLAIRSAMQDPGDVPFDRLRPGVEHALGKLASHPSARPDSIAGLTKLLSDPNPLVRSQAMLSLGRFEGYADQLMPVFDVGMASNEPRLRVAALTSLTGMRPFTPVMQLRLLPMLADKDRDVRLAAAEAVRKITPLLNGETEKTQRRDAVEQADPEIRERIEVP